eukprot:TRINITY_DN764_c1_g1_i2.p1 TRINITY_DN764_c1_g1~~TRINITY_DN764_c1_g1_i2.p1  ORF type:complete len:308 (+),score=72.04 TRINITY_DN764_c1_g1_i2:2237-3160(+)
MSPMEEYGVLTYKIGEMVRVRPRDWRTRNKCEKMWKWRATIINLTETTVGLEWIGDPPEDLEPITQGWAIHNIAKGGEIIFPSEEFGLLFHPPQVLPSQQIEDQSLYSNGYESAGEDYRTSESELDQPAEVEVLVDIPRDSSLEVEVLVPDLRDRSDGDDDNDDDDTDEETEPFPASSHSKVTNQRPGSSPIIKKLPTKAAFKEPNNTSDEESDDTEDEIDYKKKGKRDGRGYHESPLSKKIVKKPTRKTSTKITPKTPVATSPTPTKRSRSESHVFNQITDGSPVSPTGKRSRKRSSKARKFRESE